MEDLDSMLAMPVHYEWRLFETIWRFLCHSQEAIFTPNMPSTKIEILLEVKFVSCSALQTSNLPRSHPIKASMTYLPCLPWFSKGQCIECLVPAGNLQGFQRKFAFKMFRGEMPIPSLGRQMFDLNKIHSMVSWWDASFWIHPDFICCSFVSGGQSLLCSSQCTMELRCIDW